MRQPPGLERLAHVVRQPQTVSTPPGAACFRGSVFQGLFRDAGIISLSPIGDAALGPWVPAVRRERLGRAETRPMLQRLGAFR